MYEIMCRYSYYPGAIYVPSDHCVCDENGYVEPFSTRDEARQWLQDNGYRDLGDGRWVSPGTWILNHGEYGRPYCEVVRRYTGGTR